MAADLMVGRRGCPTVSVHPHFDRGSAGPQNGINFLLALMIRNDERQLDVPKHDAHGPSGDAVAWHRDEAFLG